VQADRAKADRSIFGNGQSPAKIEVALGQNFCLSQRDPEGSRDRSQRNSGAGYESLEKHISRAGLRTISTRRLVQTCIDQSSAQVEPAGNSF
jgi:hypothetical protein